LNPEQWRFNVHQNRNIFNQNGKVMSDIAEEHMDVSGLLCPEPVMMLHNKIRDIASGTVLEVVATDPSTQRDIPRFCEFLGHELLCSKAVDDTYVYLIRKA
jgi:tRNA 2-thiouridine synthesizing protein A